LRHKERNPQKKKKRMRTGHLKKSPTEKTCDQDKGTGTEPPRGKREDKASCGSANKEDTQDLQQIPQLTV